jgi:hypothetical protein
MARWKWGFLLLVAVAMFLSGCFDAAIAAPIHPDEYGPNWSAIAKWLGSAFLALVALYAKGVERRVTKIEEIADRLQRSLDRDYHVKAEIDRRFDRVDDGIGSIHERLDRLHLPSGFASRGPRIDEE